MREYTLLALLLLPVIFLMDGLLGTHLWRRRSYWIFLSIMCLGQVLVDGYLTSRPVFVFQEQFICGVRLGSIPIEDLLFGIEFVTAVIIGWEFFRGRHM